MSLIVHFRDKEDTAKLIAREDVSEPYRVVKQTEANGINRVAIATQRGTKSIVEN